MDEIIGQDQAPHTKMIRRELTRDLGSWFALSIRFTPAVANTQGNSEIY